MKSIQRPALKSALQFKVVKKRITSLFRTPFFWFVTLWGNACILGGAVAFAYLESGKNAGIHGFLDCLVWAVGIVTTVGGGGLNPVTPAGKILCILMMMGGALFLWSYMALFVGAFVNPELKDIEQGISELQHDMEEGEQFLLRLRKLAYELEVHLARQTFVRSDGGRKKSD